MPPANFTPHRGAVVRPVSFKGIFLRRRESHRKEIRGLAAPASVPTWARRLPRSLPGCGGELLGSVGADSTSLGLFASAQANRLDAGSKEFV